MNMLIEYNKSSNIHKSQFILLTPQNLSTVKEEDKVGMKILQLDAPTRL